MILKLIIIIIIYTVFATVESFQGKKVPPDVEQKSRRYDFVFGWSAGHTATTTLSLPVLYGNPSDIVFLHETHFGGHNIKIAEEITK